MAFMMWMLGKMGVASTAEDFRRYDRDFRERGHHLTIDFGGTRTGGTRWTDPNYSKATTIGLGYEYLIDRTYNGVGIEFLTQSLGRVIRSGGPENSFFVGGGLAWYPIRHVRTFVQSGAEIDVHGRTLAVGRVGAGYRFMFFKVGMQPYFFLQRRSDGSWGWAINFRFEY